MTSWPQNKCRAISTTILTNSINAECKLEALQRRLAQLEALLEANRVWTACVHSNDTSINMLTW